MNDSFIIISLGCAKNTVDADSMASLLSQAGYRLSQSQKRARVIIVNTCGFIDSAREDSYNALIKIAAEKKQGQILIAAGCLAQKEKDEIIKKVPGVNSVIGTRDWMHIVKLVDNLCQKQEKIVAEYTAVAESKLPGYSIQGASAYLKIADGCSRKCAYCSIPLIKGPAKSRPMETILAEAKKLEGLGVREIVLIAQNSTDYGSDLGITNGLALLLAKLTKTVPRIDWIRIMYAFPGYVSDELIEIMASHKQIVPYLDIPLQHAHPDTLKRMHRPSNVELVCKTIEKLRCAMPEIALRSTFIVGYPNESESEFQTLLSFVKEIRFDKLGAFKFSFETGTPSEPLGDPIPQETKDERLKSLMQLQQQISLEKNQLFVGRKLNVLVEGTNDGISVGRSYRDAPEVDGLVLINDICPVGEIVPTLVTHATTYDLIGEKQHVRRSAGTRQNNPKIRGYPIE